MNYHKIEKCSVSDGVGCRIVLYVSGCSHKCNDCHNPQTWDCNSGEKFTSGTEEYLLALLSHDYISGLTLSGGDPLFSKNREKILSLVIRVKENYPNKTIWLYTGYKFEEIKDLEILNYIDVIVDGEFERDKRDISLKFRGSSNQKIWEKKNGNWEVRE